MSWAEVWVWSGLDWATSTLCWEGGERYSTNKPMRRKHDGMCVNSFFPERYNLDCYTQNRYFGWAPRSHTQTDRHHNRNSFNKIYFWYINTPEGIWILWLKWWYRTDTESDSKKMAKSHPEQDNSVISVHCLIQTIIWIFQYSTQKEGSLKMDERELKSSVTGTVRAEIQNTTKWTLAKLSVGK